MPLDLFIINIALAIQGTLWFHANFSIFSPELLKNVIETLMGIVLNL